MSASRTSRTVSPVGALGVGVLAVLSVVDPDWAPPSGSVPRETEGAAFSVEPIAVIVEMVAAASEVVAAASEVVAAVSDVVGTLGDEAGSATAPALSSAGELESWVEVVSADGVEPVGYKAVRADGAKPVVSDAVPAEGVEPVMSEAVDAEGVEPVVPGVNSLVPRETPSFTIAEPRSPGACVASAQVSVDAASSSQWVPTAGRDVSAGKPAASGCPVAGLAVGSTGFAAVVMAEEAGVEVGVGAGASARGVDSVAALGSVT
jgi:hypothetical protein